MARAAGAANFDKHLESEADKYAAKYNYDGDRARGFEGYLVHLFAQETGFTDHLEGMEATNPSLDLSDRILRSNDLSVDVVLEDPQEKQLLLVQAKWTSRNRKPSEEELTHFLTVHDRLMNPDYVAKGGDHAQELLGDYASKIEDGYHVRLRFVCNRALGDEKDRFMEDVASHQAAYEDASKAVTCELVDKAELKNLEQQILGASEGLLKEVSFKVQSDSVVRFDEPFDLLIGRISGNELVSLFRNREYGQRLFALNIRLPMTLQRQTNKQIQKTARDEPSNFFFYNNGVSAVCESFTYNEDTNVITAKRFQIINGAQTIGALSATSPVSKDVYVLFRLTATSEGTGGEFTDKVIEFNNTQNPTVASDFRSNDKIQTFLRDHLTALSGKGPALSFQYVPKRGSKSKGKGGATLKPEELARVRYAFVHEPCMSYKEPKRFFDRSDRGLYNKAFGVDGTLLDSWDEEALAETVVALTIEDKLKRKAKSLKAEHPEDPLAAEKYLNRLARYVGALAGVGIRAVLGDEFESWSELLSSKEKFDKVVVPQMNRARELLRAEWRAREADGQVQTEYNLARDDSTWRRLSEAMVVEAKVDDEYD